MSESSILEPLALPPLSRKRPLLSLLRMLVFLKLVSFFIPSQSLRPPLPRATLRESTWFFPRKPRTRRFSHVVPPEYGPISLSNLTLREFLQHPDGFHMAIAPAFFGFFAQFGAIQAWEEAFPGMDLLNTKINSLAGASAGAMTAALLSVGISPTVAAKFCQTVTLEKFADPPGMLAAFKGELFHDIMYSFIKEQVPECTQQLQDVNIPIAVSAFDLFTMSGKILTRGSMPQAVRASACFPGLFQPVSWTDEKGTRYLLIDGGVTDPWGLEGLTSFASDTPMRIVHMALGNYDAHLGPSSMPGDIKASEIVSISLRNTPKSGPWALENGPKAVEASRLGMLASLDLPMYRGDEPGHYVLHIDTSEFIP